MELIPNIPNLPKRWDMLLFIVGILLIYFNQGSKAFLLLGIAFLGIGIIIALAEPLATLAYPEHTTKEEAISWIIFYFFVTGVILFIILLYTWTLVKM